MDDKEVLWANRKNILSSGWRGLFTKDGVLKKPLGQAHKGWKVAGFDDDLMNNAQSVLEKSQTFSLTFERRTFDCI